MSAHLVMSLRMQEPLALVRVYIFESRECCRGCKVLCSVHGRSSHDTRKSDRPQYKLKVLDEQADDFSNELQGEDFAWMAPHLHSVCTLAARSPEDSISNFRNH